jgi:hypothetical protein
MPVGVDAELGCDLAGSAPRRLVLAFGRESQLVHSVRIGTSGKAARRM